MTRKYIVEFNKDFKGLRCVGVLYNGHRCGYVGVPISHPLYNFHYIDKLPKELLYYWEKVKTRPVGKRGVVDLFCCDFSNPHVGIIFDVHGGITFAASNEDNYPIATDKKLWFFGFDCIHYDDFDKPKSQKYVEKECKKLAKQLIEISKGE